MQAMIDFINKLLLNYSIFINKNNFNLIIVGLDYMLKHAYIW